MVCCSKLGGTSSAHDESPEIYKGSKRLAVSSGFIIPNVMRRRRGDEPVDRKTGPWVSWSDVCPLPWNGQSAQVRLQVQGLGHPRRDGRRLHRGCRCRRSRRFGAAANFMKGCAGQVGHRNTVGLKTSAYKSRDEESGPTSVHHSISWLRFDECNMFQYLS